MTTFNNNLLIKQNLSHTDLQKAFTLIKMSSYWGHSIELETFNLQNSNSKTFGIFSEDNFVGFFRLITDGVFVCYLMDLIIIDNLRNKGIGSLVLKYIKDQYPKAKVILSSNKSQHFYLKNNFKFIERENNYFIIEPKEK